MRSAEDHVAWKARFIAAMKPVHDSIASIHCRKPATPTVEAAQPAPPPPTSPPIAFAPPSAAELEFEQVRRDAAARIATERETRRSGKDAVTMILDAYASFEPADRATSRTPQRGSAAEEAAADLILSFMPNRRS